MLIFFCETVYLLEVRFLQMWSCIVFRSNQLTCKCKFRPLYSLMTGLFSFVQSDWLSWLANAACHWLIVCHNLPSTIKLLNIRNFKKNWHFFLCNARLGLKKTKSVPWYPFLMMLCQTSQASSLIICFSGYLMSVNEMHAHSDWGQMTWLVKSTLWFASKNDWVSAYIGPLFHFFILKVVDYL